MVAFIADPDPDDNFFALSGFAGTGKTFLMREVIKRFAASHAQFAFTAPTNKAAKVLRGVTGSACTIYSLLGLRIEKNGELKELVTGKSPIELDSLDAVFLDEASMINQNLMKVLREESKRNAFKVIFMGDSAQLPPVGEVTSPVWQLDNGAMLTQVMRHDNQILELVTEIRERMMDFSPSITIQSHHDKTEGVWKLSRQAFKDAIFTSASNGGFSDGGKTKVIAWRNVRVGEFNDLIRRAIFGAEAVEGNFLPGDRIIATEPLSRGDEPLMSTDDEAIVENCIATTHPTVPKYKAWELKCRTEMNTIVRLLVLHPSSAADYANDLQELAHKAKATPKLWKAFWNLNDLFHKVKYAYAITAHRAQGSTYETVFVDYQDILLNRSRKEAFQCLYVACSRPTTRLILA